jgi:DNA-binding transcriptional MerR regulator
MLWLFVWNVKISRPIFGGYPKKHKPVAQYSIRDLEILSGVKAHTLRIWEQRYDFLKPHRTDTNIRFYTDEQLKNVLNISLLNRNGFRISKIAKMKNEDLNNEVLKISSDNAEPNVYLDSLVHSMLDFDEARFEKTLSSAIVSLGFESTFNTVIFPFMQRTGILWTTGAVRPVQEHFITNLIRRKITVAIDSQFVKVNEKSKKFVLFLPSGETHELLLLFTEYLLRNQNHQVAYVGASVPFEDISFIHADFKPNFLLTFITVTPSEMPLQDYINKLSETFPETKILVGGAQIMFHPVTLPSNVFSVKSCEQLLELIQ